jgi:hypothetical protein
VEDAKSLFIGYKVMIRLIIGFRNTVVVIALIDVHVVLRLACGFYNSGGGGQLGSRLPNLGNSSKPVQLTDPYLHFRSLDF